MSAFPWRHCLLLAVLVAGASRASGEPLRVLFVGNSQMSCCDVPRMVEVIANSAPVGRPRIAPSRAVTGGRSLARHWAEGVGETIAAGGWDWVILQEIYNADAASFEAHAALLEQSVRRAGARPLLFATANVTRYYNQNGSASYPESFRHLNDMQIAFGSRRHVPVAAAGYGWMRFLGPDPPEPQLLDLYDADRGHPGPKGSYLYACLLYAHLTGGDPTGLVAEFPDIGKGISIDPAAAARLQLAAWEQYQEDARRDAASK